MKPKRQIERIKELVITQRIPTVEECEKCIYQKKCEGGRFCTEYPYKGVKNEITRN